MKTIKRMTNPCFQETPFATVMKGKHVLNEPDETDLKSDHVEESSGQAMVGDREEEVSIKRKQKDPITNRSFEVLELQGGILYHMRILMISKTMIYFL